MAKQKRQIRDVFERVALARQQRQQSNEFSKDLGFEALQLNGFRVTQDRERVRAEIERAIRRRREDEC